MKQRKKKHKILVVEDDNTTRKLLKQILEKADYEVIDCSEGRDAIHLAQMCQPKVMIIDVMLPDMEGTAIVEELQYFPNCRAIKCIFLTGILKNRGVGTKCRFQIEGKEYKALAKPILKSQLLRLVGETITAHLREQEDARLAAIEKEQKALRDIEEMKRLEAIRKKEAADKEDSCWYLNNGKAEDAVFEDIS